MRFIIQAPCVHSYLRTSFDCVCGGRREGASMGALSGGMVGDGGADVLDS